VRGKDERGRAHIGGIFSRHYARTKGGVMALAASAAATVAQVKVVPPNRSDEMPGQ